MTGASIHTFLIADIRGYTRFTAKLVWTLRRSLCLQCRLKRSALRLQERVGYAVTEPQQAGSGQCQRHRATPPDGVG